MYKEIAGKIIAEIGQKYGKTKSGKYFETRDYLIEIDGGTQYVHSVKFTMSSFDGPIKEPINVGDTVKVGLKIVAHQFNGKWFNDISLVQWERLEPAPMS